MSYLMSVQRSRSPPVGSSSIRDQSVGEDCIVVDRVRALYGVDGLLNYDL